MVDVCYHTLLSVYLKQFYIISMANLQTVLYEFQIYLEQNLTYALHRGMVAMERLEFCILLITLLRGTTLLFPITSATKSNYVD